MNLQAGDLITKNEIEYEVIKKIGKTLYECKKTYASDIEKDVGVTYFIDTEEEKVYNEDVKFDIAKDFATTLIYFAEERLKEGHGGQNLNSAIHTLQLEIVNILMERMKYEKGG